MPDAPRHRQLPRPGPEVSLPYLPYISYASPALHVTRLICLDATYRTQNAALIANAYARLQRNHTALLGHLSRELTCLPAAAFVGSGGAKDLSNLLNSYARLEYRDAAFFAHLAGAARRLHATKAIFGAQVTDCQRLAPEP